MSARALLRAVETRLRSPAVLDDPEGRVCGIQPDGRPPPNAGQVYYAIHWSGGRANLDHSDAAAVDVEHAVTVTITGRLGFVPVDRRGEKLSDPNELIDLAEGLAAPGVIQGNYAELIDVANDLIDPAGTSTNGFEEPLWVLGYGPVEEKPANWVRAKDGKDVYAIEVRFGKARRLQI